MLNTIFAWIISIIIALLITSLLVNHYDNTVRLAVVIAATLIIRFTVVAYYLKTERFSHMEHLRDDVLLSELTEEESETQKEADKYKLSKKHSEEQVELTGLYLDKLNKQYQPPSQYRVMGENTTGKIEPIVHKGENATDIGNYATFNRDEFTEHHKNKSDNHESDKHESKLSKKMKHDAKHAAKRNKHEAKRDKHIAKMDKHRARRDNRSDEDNDEWPSPLLPDEDTSSYGQYDQEESEQQRIYPHEQEEYLPHEQEEYLPHEQEEYSPHEQEEYSPHEQEEEMSYPGEEEEQVQPKKWKDLKQNAARKTTRPNAGKHIFANDTPGPTQLGGIQGLGSQSPINISVSYSNATDNTGNKRTVETAMASNRRPVSHNITGPQTKSLNAKPLNANSNILPLNAPSNQGRFFDNGIDTPKCDPWSTNAGCLGLNGTKYEQKTNDINNDKRNSRYGNQQRENYRNRRKDAKYLKPWEKESSRYCVSDVTASNPDMNCKPKDFQMSSYGWSYMPPTAWSVPQHRPPVCISDPEKKCSVCPVEALNKPYSEFLSADNWDVKNEKIDMKYSDNYYYPGWKAKNIVK